MDILGMFDLYSHSYELSATGLPRNMRSRIFGSRGAATEYMYGLCAKYHAKIEKVYDDNHDKTYCCSGGIRFYVHRI